MQLQSTPALAPSFETVAAITAVPLGAIVEDGAVLRTTDIPEELFPLDPTTPHPKEQTVSNMKLTIANKCTFKKVEPVLSTTSSLLDQAPHPTTCLRLSCEGDFPAEPNSSNNYSAGKMPERMNANNQVITLRKGVIQCNSSGETEVPVLCEE